MGSCLMSVASLALVGLAMSSPIRAAEPLFGKVVGIADGDTITVLLNEHKQVHVRIMGIDAPEKKQAFGQRSKQSMSDCAFGKEVQVEWNKVDRYGRTIGKVVADGVDCGRRQIELGHAWHYKAYAKEQTRDDRASYAAAEDKAKADRLGLWSDPDPMPPWEYRHGGSKR